MPKTKISEFSSTPANNTDIDSINIAEGCAPSGINDAIRELMAQLKDFQVGSAGDPVTVGGVLTVQAGTAAAPAITTTGDTNTGIFFPAADTIAFAEGGAEAMRLDSSGNLGLGVTPSASESNFGLQVGTAANTSYVYSKRGVANNAYYDGAWKYYGTGAATLHQFNSGVYAWYNAPSGTAGNAITFTQAMTLDASGNLGIGTTSPSRKLSVYDTSNIPVRIETNTSDTKIEILTTSGTQYIQASANNLLFGTNNTERARIDSSGNLLVGTTATSAGARLYVRGSGSSNAAARFYNPDLTDSNYTLYVDKPSATTTTSQVFIGFTVNAQGTGSGQINANGASQAAFGSFSDARLKENIVDLTPQLSNLMALRPVEFDYKDGSGHQTGFVAQEMQQVYPDAIGEQNGFLTVSGYGKTEARLIKAIQEQQAIIESLKARLDAANL